MIETLIGVLQKAGLELSARDLADALWLAGFIDAPAEIELPSAETERRDDDATTTGKTITSDETRREGRSDPVGAPAGAPADASADLLLPGQGDDETADQGAGRLPFRSPTGRALPGPLEIERALRPLMRRVPSRVRFLLDEEATVERIADEDNWVPVLRPAPSRWLDLALVVDDSPSMAIWRQTIAELGHLLEHHGAFRTVQTWGFAAGKEDGALRLYKGFGSKTPQGTDVRELVDASGRRLILLLSDCVAPYWQSSKIADALRAWGQLGLVAIVQVLPQTMWLRSGLRLTVPVALRSSGPGTPNHDLRVHYTRPRDRLRQPAGLAVPVATLEPRLLIPWAQSLAGMGQVWVPGVLYPVDFPSTSSRNDVLSATGAAPTARQLVDDFRGTASPMAWQLAGYLAAAPLSLPVMRLVQRAMLPSSRQVHLAEVFLSGLFQRDPASDLAAHPDDVRYEFAPGVRDLLVSSVYVSDAVDVMASVSDYIAQQTGSGFNFRAMLADPTTAGQHDSFSHGLPFASVTSHVLRRLGGRYAQFALQLEQRPTSMPRPDEGPPDAAASDTEQSTDPGITSDERPSDASASLKDELVDQATRLSGAEPRQAQSHPIDGSVFDKLAEAHRAGQLVWFIGQDLPRSLTGLPSRADLAADLAKEFGLRGQPESPTFFEVSKEIEQLAGRGLLVQAISRRVSDPRRKAPPRPHILDLALAELARPGLSLVTTRFDNLLEHSLKQQNKPFGVFGPDELSWFDPDRVALTWLWGDVRDPGRLVLTQADLAEYFSHESTYSDMTRALSAKRATIVFLGFDPASPDLPALLNFLPGYPVVVLTDAPVDQIDRPAWLGETVDLVHGSALELVQGVKDRIAESTLSASQPAKWTVLLYMAGDNGRTFSTRQGSYKLMAGLTEAGWKVLSELSAIGSSQDVRLLAEFDTLEDSQTFRFEIQQARDPKENIVETIPETNSGSPQTLSNFLVWGIQRAPAENLLLVVWDHGAFGFSDIYATFTDQQPRQPRFSTPEMAIPFVAFDDTSMDFLSPMDVRDAISLAETITGRHIDVLGFDADLTGAVEALHECRKVADYAIAVQDVVSINGWPWAAICKELIAHPSQSPAALCQAIITATETRSTTMATKRKPNVAVSAIDLRTLDRLSDQMTQLVNALTVAYPTDPALQSVLAASSHSLRQLEDPNIVDLVSLLQSLLGVEPEPSESQASSTSEASSSEVLVTAKTLLEWLQSEPGPILRSIATGKLAGYANGLSIYWPQDKAPVPGYRQLEFAKTGWYDFLQLLAQSDMSPAA